MRVYHSSRTLDQTTLARASWLVIKMLKIGIIKKFPFHISIKQHGQKFRSVPQFAGFSSINLHTFLLYFNNGLFFLIRTTDGPSAMDGLMFNTCFLHFYS